MLYGVPVLIGCWSVLGIRCCDQFWGPLQAFQTTQMLAASLLGDLGTISVGIIYVVFTLGGFFAPAICRIVGPRMGM